MTETGGKPPFLFRQRMSPCSLFLLRRLTTARHKRCLWSVSRVRRARDGRFYRSRLASGGQCTPARRPFLMKRLQAAFRAYNLAVRKTTAAVFHGRPDPLPDAVNSPQAAGNGHHRGALPVPSVREGVWYVPFCPR